MQPYGCPAHPNLSANSKNKNYFLITVKPTNNGLLRYVTIAVQIQQNSRFIVSLYRPVVVLRPGRPEVRILPVAPRAAPYGVLLFLLCADFMEQKKSGFEQPVPRALRPAGQKRPGGAFLGHGLANPFGHAKKAHCNVLLQCVFLFRVSFVF